MTAIALTAGPQRRDLIRWIVAGSLVLAAHMVVIAALITGRPGVMAPGAPLPPILVDLSPISAAPDVQLLDLAPGPQMQQADALAPSSRPPTEEQTIAPESNPVVTLLPEQKRVSGTRAERSEAAPQATRTPDDRVPAPKTTAPPAAERQVPAQNAAAAGAAIAAKSASYGAQLAAHLQRFKQYPSTARSAGEHGIAVLNFTVSRSGRVLHSRIARSSGHPALDADTLALLRRAEPLPAFPPEMRQESKSFSVPISYTIQN